MLRRNSRLECLDEFPQSISVRFAYLDEVRPKAYGATREPVSYIPCLPHGEGYVVAVCCLDRAVAQAGVVHDVLLAGEVARRREGHFLPAVGAGAAVVVPFCFGGGGASQKLLEREISCPEHILCFKTTFCTPEVSKLRNFEQTDDF